MDKRASEFLKHQTAGTGTVYPTSEREFFVWCIHDPKFFLEACTKIRVEDDAGVPHDVTWRFNPIQLDYHFSVYSYIEPHHAVCVVPDRLVLKTRQYGQSTYELGDIFHSWCFKSTTNKIITYAEKTAQNLKLIIDTFYQSAWKFFETEMHMDPRECLPYADKDNDHELQCKATGAAILFTTQAAKGAGRSATVHRIYGTEFSEWDNVSDVMSGYGGSLAKRGTQVSLDGTGKGVGNAMYREYQAAKRGESVYRPYFYGRDSHAYDPEFLERQQKRLGALFDREFPLTDRDAFRQEDNAVFDHEHIEACAEREARYLCDDLRPKELATRVYAHGVDTAEGTPNGDYSVIKTRDIETGLEACPPYRKKVGPRELAIAAAKRQERYPGVWVVENIGLGAATVERLEDSELPMYRHPQPGKKLRECKVGFPTTGPTKRPILETDYSQALADQAINLPSENGVREASEYCLNTNGKTGAPQRNDSDGYEFHDDEVIADMLCLQGFEQAARWKGTQRKRTPAMEAIAVGSMRDDL